MLFCAVDLLLSCYVGMHGHGLSTLVERSVCDTNWLQAQPPRAPRPVCDLFLERLGRTESELARLVDGTSRAAGSHSGRIHTHCCCSTWEVVASVHQLCERGFYRSDFNATCMSICERPGMLLHLLDSASAQCAIRTLEQYSACLLLSICRS